MLDAGRRLDDLGDLPALRGSPRRAAPSRPRSTRPAGHRVDDLREVVLKPPDSIMKSGIAWRPTRRGCATEPTRSRSRRDIPHRVRGRFDRGGLGSQRRAAVRVDPRAGLGRAVATAGGPAVEILNFAVPGHAPGQRWYHFGQVGWPMRPDLVIFESTQADAGWDERRLRRARPGPGFDSPLYRDGPGRPGVEPALEPGAIQAGAPPRHREILAGVYRTMAADCRARGVPIVWVLIPRVGRPSDPAVHRALMIGARRGVQPGRRRDRRLRRPRPGRLAVEPDDFHPNPEGHARLARRLDAALSELPELQPLRGQGLADPVGP